MGRLPPAAVAEPAEAAPPTAEDIEAVAQQAARILTEKLFPGKSDEDVVTREELEAAGLAEVRNLLPWRSS